MAGTSEKWQTKQEIVNAVVCSTPNIVNIYYLNDKRNMVAEYKNEKLSGTITSEKGVILPWKIGDYIVKHANNSMEVLTAADFKVKYEQVTSGAQS